MGTIASSASKGTWLTSKVESWLGHLASTAYKRPLVTLGCIALVCTGSLLGARNLSVDADLTQLLPETFQSVQDLNILKKRFGGVGYVVVMGMGAPRKALEQFADDLHPLAETLNTVRYVDSKRPREFFDNHGLYYFDREDLELIRDRLVAREAFERRTRNPLYLDLEDEEPPSLDFPGLKNKYSADTKSGGADSSWIQAQMGETYYIDADKKMIAVLCKPKDFTDELYFSKSVVDDVKNLVHNLDKTPYGKDFHYGFAGRFVKRVDQQTQLTRDLRITSIVAILGMLAYLAIHFRRIAAIVLVMLPLMTGLLWTFGFAGMVFGVLNILTAFIGVVLLGLGIDHGIHLLSRFEAEWYESDPKDAIRNTFGNTGRAVVIAALTTTVAFAGLGLSEFRAFREFGVLAAAGMVLVVLAYTTLLPALLGLATGAGWQPRRVGNAKQFGYAHWLLSHSGRALIIGIVIVVVLCFGLTQSKFNYDFSALEANHLPSSVLDLEANKLVGYSQSPAIVLTQSMDEERAVAAALRKRVRERGDRSAVDFIAASTDLIPLHQPQKRPIIEEIGRVVKKVKLSWLDPEQRLPFKRLKSMVDELPFTKEELPAAVQRQFWGEHSEKEDGFLLIFPSISLSDGLRVREFADEIRGVPLPGGGTISAAGETLILADILNMIYREAPPVLAFTLLLVFIAMWLLLGNLRMALLCLIPAIITIIGTLSLLPVVGIDLNYLNIILIPVLFGIGVDGGVHLVTRFDGVDDFSAMLSETGRAIAGAIMTTGFGFSALMLADHAGLNSMGQMATLGLGINLLACLLALPTVLAWRRVRAASRHVG